MNDKELVSRMQHGDMQAFDELYERYKDDAYRLACLITGSRTDGEDLAQEAFVTCAQSIKSLRDGSKFRPWLLRTLSRAAWKYCRKAKRETPVSEFFDAGESESALSAVLRTDEQRRLYAALDTLDEKRRVTVVLYYFDDRSVREIAQATGVTEGTVKSRLFSARRHLRQALTDRESRPKEVASGADRRTEAEGGCKSWMKSKWNVKSRKCCISVQMSCMHRIRCRRASNSH